MFLFGKKPETIDISGQQLYTILQKALTQAEEEVNGKDYLTGPEIMFDYQDNTHFAGIRYDKKRAKKERLTSFDSNLSSVYVDKQEFATPEDAFENAIIDGVRLQDISEGLITFPEFANLL